MRMAFEIRIVNGDDKGVANVRVQIAFEGIGRGMAEARTDGDGRAHFEHYMEGGIKVYVDGRERGHHRYRDGVSITLPR
jgi:hypothetical protein